MACGAHRVPTSQSSVRLGELRIRQGHCLQPPPTAAIIRPDPWLGQEPPNPRVNCELSVDPDLRQAIEKRRLRPTTTNGPKPLTTPADIVALARPARAELSRFFLECFPSGRGIPPPTAELARFFDAVLFVEYRMDSLNLWPPKLRQRAWDSAAHQIGWPVDRLMQVADWWYGSLHRRELSTFA